MLEGQEHEWLVSGPPADPYMYQATVFSGFAALALVTWDVLLTLDDEVVHMWSRPGRTHVKFIYLFARWFGLVNQIGIQIWRYFIATYSPVPVKTCEIYFIFEAVAFQLLQLCLDAILFLQIRAVYQRHCRYIAIAASIIVFETFTSIMTQAISVPKSVVDGNCIMLQTPMTTTCIGIAMMVSQCVLLSLTYRGKVRMQPAAGRSKIVTVVMRDGILVFGVVVGIVLISILYLLFNRVVINVFFPWLVAAPSILTPRMILNMQMAAEPTESRVEFTTEFDIMLSNYNDAQLTSAYEADVIHEEPRDSP